jgi:hypothetical protein
MHLINARNMEHIELSHHHLAVMGGEQLVNTFRSHNTEFYVLRTMYVFWNENCIMANTMHKFLIYLSIYICRKYSGFLLAQLQRQVYNFGSGSSLLGMVSAPGADTIPRRLEPLPKLYVCL